MSDTGYAAKAAWKATHYHMSDNADWPKPREAGTHLIYTR
ncbi:X polypeptide domain protein [Escherichia coli 5-172-05_S3_C1]|nr:X polypeptide domain protein [Escherichia coli 5-172-05_S3_C1]